jgi:hypothetical protein
VIFLLSPFENLHHSLFYLSILFLTFFSSCMFQMRLWPSLHFFLGSMFVIHRVILPVQLFYTFLFYFQTYFVRNRNDSPLIITRYFGEYLLPNFGPSGHIL